MIYVMKHLLTDPVATLSVALSNAQTSPVFSPNQPAYSSISVSQADRVLVSGLPPSTAAAWAQQPVAGNTPLPVNLSATNTLVVSFGQASMNYTFTSVFGNDMRGFCHLSSYMQLAR